MANSLIPPAPNTEGTLHLLTAQYFYPTSEITVNGNGATATKTIAITTITKRRDGSKLLVRTGGIIKVSNYVGGMGIGIGNLRRTITVANIATFVGVYGQELIAGVAAGQHTAELYLYVTPNSGTTASTTASSYQYYPIEVYEIY